MTSSTTNQQLDEHILELEKQLAAPMRRMDAETLDQLLADNFVEFGASGRRFTKQEIIALLAAEESFTQYDLLEFEVRRLSDETVLALYRIPARTSADGTLLPGSRRSSIWTLTEGRWQLSFHQGTRIAET